MRFEVPESDRKRAKIPHEIFLTNLIVNHILLFVALLGMAESFPAMLLTVPGISVLALAYTVYRARRARRADSWYVCCHWQVSARRSRFFMLMLGVMAVVMAVVLLIAGGAPKPQHFAVGGVGMLPTLLTVLVLIVMESDSVHHAGTGQLPKWVVERYPNPNMTPIGE